MDRIAAILHKQIEDQVNALRDAVSSGGAKDFPEYHRICGKIAGLLNARQLITDLTIAMEKNDE
jgi:hypothetical protein